MNNFDLEKKIYSYMTGIAGFGSDIVQEPFFAHLSREIRKMPSTAVPTAGVRVGEDGRYEMLYNPEFMSSLSPKHLIGVYKHELYHLIFDHCEHRLPEEGMSKKWNVATDLAINSLIGQASLPEACLYPGQEGTLWEDLPAFKSAEWYMSNINWPENFEDGQGEGGVGDHGEWGKECPPHLKKAAERAFKKALKDATKEANKSRGWGSVPHHVKLGIMKSLETRIDWKGVLRYFIKTSQRANRRNSIKSINRRYPYIHPGRTQSRTAKIAISIDQSGSVSDGMLVAFFKELNKLASLAEFTVVPFDTRVAEDKIYIWKKGQRRTWERVLSGGTCFNAPTKWVNENNFDGHIVLTDMMAPKPVRSNCQRMWMTTHAHAANPWFQTNERVIAIDEEM